MSPLKDLITTLIDSFGAFMTTLLTGWYDAFIGPFFTVVAGWFGLPTG